MRTFHVQLLIQLATESYTIHRAAKDSILKILVHLFYLVSAYLKRNEETITRPLKKKKQANKKRYYISEKNANEQIKLKSFLKILFREYIFIIKSIARSLIVFKKPRKMTNDFFNNYDIVLLFCFENFMFQEMTSDGNLFAVATCKIVCNCNA